MMKGRCLMFVLVVMALLTSCIDDSKVENTYRQLSTTSILGEYYMFTTDAGEKLIATQIPNEYSFEEGKRVMVMFNNIQASAADAIYDYQITVTGIQDIMTKDVIEINEENKDTLGVEGVYIDQMFLSNKFLNVSTTFYASGKKPHYLSLSVNKDEQPDEENEISLVMHHKSKDDIGEANQPFQSFISYDLRSLGMMLTPPYTLIVHYKDMQKNNKEHRIEVKE